MANFQDNQWYQITLKASSALSLATSNTTNNGTGSIFFQRTNTSQPNQRWQLWNAQNDSYVLRSGNSGPYGYMIAIASLQDTSSVAELNSGNTVPAARNYANITDDAFSWTIGPWGDGTFHLTNAANGSAWHLQKNSNTGLVTMSSNVTGSQPGQRFVFNSLGKITNKAFETLNLPPSASTSVHPTQTSIDLSDSHGLSTPAIAGIAASIGALAILSVILGILLFLRRRRSKQMTKDAGYTNMYSSKEGAASAPAWNSTPQYNYAAAGYAPYSYLPPDQVGASHPHAFAELSQDASQIPELSSGGADQADGARKNQQSDAKMSPVELDTRGSP